MLRGTLALAAVALFAHCSRGSSGASPPPPPPIGTGLTATATIGPEGGTVSLEHITLTIPAGALASGQAITVTSSKSPAPSSLSPTSPVYSFAPSGQTFAKPVSVAFDDSDGARQAIWWSGAGAAGFDPIGLAPGGPLSAAVTHFSDGFVGARPSSSMAVQFAVDTPPIVYACNIAPGVGIGSGIRPGNPNQQAGVSLTWGAGAQADARCPAPPGAPVNITLEFLFVGSSPDTAVTLPAGSFALQPGASAIAHAHFEYYLPGGLVEYDTAGQTAVGFVTLPGAGERFTPSVASWNQT